MCNQLSMSTYYLKIIGATVSIAQSFLMLAVNFYPCFCAGTEQNSGEKVKHHPCVSQTAMGMYDYFQHIFYPFLKKI